jgi:hypothetical protein
MKSIRVNMTMGTIYLLRENLLSYSLYTVESIKQT